MNRKCSYCKEVKDSSEFYETRNGIGYVCKACSREKNREYYTENRTEIILRLRGYRKRNKAKLKAQGFVMRAVKKGNMKKEPCAICGELNVRMYFEDYTKPMNVLWLCSRHYEEKELRDEQEIQRSYYGKDEL